jgi:diguanylate cyclase (GGDEF)-like protein
LACLVYSLQFLRMDVNHLILFAVLIIMASLAQVYKVEGTTNRSHYAVSFAFYAFSLMLLGVPATLIIIIISNAAEWIKNRGPWFISLFNISIYILSTVCAQVVYSVINPSDNLQSWVTVLAILAGMAVFTMLDHLLVGVVIWLARGQNFSTSGIFDLLPLLVDLTMLVIGASLNLVWNYNPYAVLLFIIPLYLIYSTLRVPALERKVEMDSKTGIYNNEYFMAQFQNELPRANRFDRPLTVIMADLDLLRNVNNTYGHLAGDEVIKGIARIIQFSVREYDVVSRFGGEEFGILMPETPLEIGYARAEMIRQAVEKAEFSVPTSATPIKVTISLGIACRENSAQTREEIIHNADAALFHSKLKGRNCSFAYSEANYPGIKQVINQNTLTSEPDEAKPDASDYSAAFTSFQNKEGASEPQEATITPPENSAQKHKKQKR